LELFNISNLITVQQDATYSVYYISVGSSTCIGCWHPSLYSCNYSFWYWLTGCDSVTTQQRERVVVDPVNQYQKLQLQLYQLLMMGVNTLNM